MTLFVKTHFRKISWKNDLSRGKTEVKKPAMRSLTHARCTPHATSQGAARARAAPSTMSHSAPLSRTLAGP
eukprot:4624981-Prymnesium_polylepis.1